MYSVIKSGFGLVLLGLIGLGCILPNSRLIALVLLSIVWLLGQYRLLPGCVPVFSRIWADFALHMLRIPPAEKAAHPDQVVGGEEQKSFLN